MQYYNERVERMSRDEKHALQSERLKKVVKLAYERCKPYRQKMIDAGVTPEDINSIDDIVKLPFTTKQDLRNNYPFGMFSAPMDDIVRIHASSGRNVFRAYGRYRQDPRFVGDYRKADGCRNYATRFGRLGGSRCQRYGGMRSYEKIDCPRRLRIRFVYRRIGCS